MSTIFIAVQCYQCSTMQVKQQKKSGNKWTCVVCNQKQSIRKVFAHGYVAKDLRKFVQSFNLSRKFAEENLDSSQFATLIPESESDITGFDRKKRNDWSEYLNPEETCKEKESEGDDFGPKIVTELPKEMFKKPKLRNLASGSGAGGCNGGDDKLYKPVFTKRKADKQVVPQDNKFKKDQSTEVISAVKWNKYMKEDNEEPRKHQAKVATMASKWNDYISDDEDNFKLRSNKSTADQCGHDGLETVVYDQKVEDDVHPDFM